MKMNKDNFETVFFQRQNALFLALERQKKVFNKYLPDLYRKGVKWEDIHNWDFNLIHDLEDRLKQRLEALQNEYYSLHWDKYKFNAY